MLLTPHTSFRAQAVGNEQPLFVALHMQEVGGKSLETQLLDPIEFSKWVLSLAHMHMHNTRSCPLRPPDTSSHTARSPLIAEYAALWTLGRERTSSRFVCLRVGWCG